VLWLAGSVVSLAGPRCDFSTVSALGFEPATLESVAAPTWRPGPLLLTAVGLIVWVEVEHGLEFVFVDRVRVGDHQPIDGVGQAANEILESTP